MKDFYKNTRNCIDKYNQVTNKILNSIEKETDDEEDEFFDNFCIHLAHALIKDTGTSQRPREELSKVADIINDVVR